MVGLNAYRRDSFEHPTIGLAVVVALVVWTAAAIWLYRGRARRTTALLLADLAIALAAMAATPVVKTPEFNATIPGFWVMGALLAWAIHWHWKGGLAAGALIAVVDLLPRSEIDQGNYGNVFLVLIGGPVVGYLCESLQRMARERDAAEHAAAAAEERTRLARAVHDGVLQVLAMTQRRGAAAGGEWAELGRLAGEQERSLRSLIRQQDTVPTAAGGPSAQARPHRTQAPAPPPPHARAPPRRPRTRRGRHARRPCARGRARRHGGRCRGAGVPGQRPGARRSRRRRVGARPVGGRRDHDLRARRRTRYRPGQARRGRGGGTVGRRVLDPRPHRGPRRHRPGGERLLGHRVGAQRAASVTG